MVEGALASAYHQQSSGERYIVDRSPVHSKNKNNRRKKKKQQLSSHWNTQISPSGINKWLKFSVESSSTE